MPPLPASDFFRTLLKRHLPIVRGPPAEVDVQEYFIEDVDKILGILRHMTL